MSPHFLQEGSKLMRELRSLSFSPRPKLHFISHGNASFNTSFAVITLHINRREVNEFIVK